MWRVVHDSNSILFEVLGYELSHVRLRIVLMQHSIIEDVWKFPHDVHTEDLQDLVVILFINSHLRKTHIVVVTKKPPMCQIVRFHFIA